MLSLPPSKELRTLRHLHTNDEILLTTLDASCRYIVDWIKVVKPDDTHVLNPVAVRR